MPSCGLDWKDDATDPCADARADPGHPGRPLVLYDGHCPFCTSQAQSLGRLAEGRLELRPLQEEGVLARVGVSEVEARRELKLVDGGRVYGGAAAVVRALELARPALKPLVRLYELPVVRPVADRLYRWVADHRYRLFGRRAAPCQGRCALPDAEGRAK